MRREGEEESGGVRVREKKRVRESERETFKHSIQQKKIKIKSPSGAEV